MNFPVLESVGRDDQRGRAAFTLVEMLVVVAIVGVLMALLMPALQSAREAGRRSSCLNNLKQIALAIESHKTSLGHFPTGGWSNGWVGDSSAGADWRQPGGWCFTILPYLDAANLYGGAQITTATTNLPNFVCPTRRPTGLVTRAVIGPSSINTATVWMHSDYAGNRGSWSSSAPADGTILDRATQFMPTLGALTVTLTTAGVTASRQSIETTLNSQQPIPDGTATAISVATGGVIYAASALPPAQIRDGFANTYLVGEKYVPSTDYATGSAAGDSQCAYIGDSPDNLRGGHRGPESDSTAFVANMEGAFGGPHPGVFNMAMCDGSVRTIDLLISAQVHFLLACRADRQVVPLPD